MRNKPPLLLYLLKRTDYYGYDEYDSLIVAATSQSKAKKIEVKFWTSPENISAEFIGTAGTKTKPGIILGSFNAG